MSVQRVVFDRTRMIARTISACLGAAVVLPQTTLLIAFQGILNSPDMKFANPLFNAMLVPLVVVLTTLPTEAAVLAFAACVPRDITSGEARASLVATSALPILMLVATCCTDPLRYMSVSNFFWLVVILSVAQSILVAPYKSFAYALTSTAAFRHTMPSVVTGIMLLAVVQSSLTALSDEWCVQICNAVAVVVFFVAYLAIRQTQTILMAPPVQTVEAPEVRYSGPVYTGPDSVYKETTITIEPEEPPSAWAATVEIIRDGWVSMLTIVIVQATACSVYPTICIGVKPYVMGATAFGTLGVFVIPHAGAIIGAAIGSYAPHIGRWAELGLAILRMVLSLGFMAVSNYEPQDAASRWWAPILITNDYVYLSISALLFTVNGIFAVVMYRTLEISVAHQHAPKAASLSTVFAFIGGMVGLIIAVAFPYVI